MIIAAALRGADLTTSASGIAWFLGAAVLLGIAMYGVAETLSNRIPTVEEYTGALPAIAIVPFFFAGSLFPITALPWALTGFARVLPLTHALAVMRYGLLDHNTSGLHDIWGMSNATLMAATQPRCRRGLRRPVQRPGTAHVPQVGRKLIPAPGPLERAWWPAPCCLPERRLMAGGSRCGWTQVCSSVTMPASVGQ